MHSCTGRRGAGLCSLIRSDERPESSDSDLVLIQSKCADCRRRRHIARERVPCGVITSVVYPARNHRAVTAIVCRIDAASVRQRQAACDGLAQGTVDGDYPGSRFRRNARPPEPVADVLVGVSKAARTAGVAVRTPLVTCWGFRTHATARQVTIGAYLTLNCESVVTSSGGCDRKNREALTHVVPSWCRG